jgi:hypothetical protein
LKGENGDLRWTVEPEGKAYGAYATVDVHLHLIELIWAFGIFFAHGRQDERAEKREPDLTAVGVACEQEIDEMSAGMCDDVVGVVGLMGEKDYGGVWVGGDGEVEVRVAGAGVLEATEPETGAVFLDCDIFVDQNGGAVAGEGVGHQGGVEGDVVVAEDGVAEGSGEFGDDLGATIGGVSAGDEGEGAVGDEVSGEQDQVGGETVNDANDVLKEVGLGVLVEVDVADLHDAVAVEGAGQVGDWDGTMNDVDLMAGDFACVEGHACCDSSGADEEVASGKARRLIGLRTGHKP